MMQKKSLFSCKMRSILHFTVFVQFVRHGLSGGTNREFLSGQPRRCRLAAQPRGACRHRQPARRLADAVSGVIS